MPDNMPPYGIPVPNCNCQDCDDAREHGATAPATHDRYVALRKVLDAALSQASIGKGAQRHDNGEDFTKQPICQINRDLGTPDFCLGQAIKKAIECKGMDTKSAERELLGAIVYLAAAVIWWRENG